MFLSYPGINQVKTGQKLKQLILASGFSVKEIQEYLHLSCPQPIYRWFKGTALPSVDHLYALACLLHCDMNEFLVSNVKINPIQYRIQYRINGYLRILAQA